MKIVSIILTLHVGHNLDSTCDVAFIFLRIGRKSPQEAKEFVVKFEEVRVLLRHGKVLVK